MFRAGEMVLYLDGNKVASGSTSILGGFAYTTVLGSNSDPGIGATYAGDADDNQSGGGQPSHFFDGYLDELRIYESGFGLAQIRSIYAAGITRQDHLALVVQ